MRRFYISPIIGNGTETNPYRASAADKGKSYLSIIPTGADGIPLFRWALCVVNTTDHTPLTGDATIEALPDISLDSQLSVLPTNVRNNLVNKLTQRGVDMTGISASSTFSDVLNRIGRTLDSLFRLDRFDAKE